MIFIKVLGVLATGVLAADTLDVAQGAPVAGTSVTLADDTATNTTETETYYTYSDYENLIPKLATTCDVNNLLVCPGTPETTLTQIDTCLATNNCLTYHQSLTLKEKVYSDTERPPSNQLDDLQEAEVNYLCLKNCIDMTGSQQTCYNTCEHEMTQLFKKAKYQEAIDTQFVLQQNFFTTEMIVIFSAIGLIIVCSAVMLCKNARKNNANKRKRRQAQRQQDEQYFQTRHDQYSDSSQYSGSAMGNSTYFGEVEKNSALHVPLMSNQSSSDQTL